ncbi:MAG: hypothetical protein GWO16_13060, partial [Gammaproteobacteria bacterium]|nr:hypothetical protein [Gammaproteobacteria bacterium]
MQFEFSLWALLRGKAQVQALELVQPTVNLRQNPDGEWNAATLAAAPEEEEPPSAEAPAASPVRNWRIEDGTILIERPDQPTLRLTGVELAATDISTTEPFPVRLAVSFAEQSRISTDGRLGPLDLSAPARTPFQGELRLEQFRPDALSSLITVPPELARLGAMSGTLKLRSGREEIAAQGKITLLGSEEEDDLSLQLDVKLPPDLRRVEASETIVEYGEARVRAQGSVELAPPYALNLALTTSEAELGALRQVPLRLGYPLPVSPPAATGRVTSDLKLEGTPEEWVASGKAKVTRLAVKPEGFPETLRTDSLELTLDPERITAAPFNLSLAPGVV